MFGFKEGHSLLKYDMISQDRDDQFEKQHFSGKIPLTTNETLRYEETHLSFFTVSCDKSVLAKFIPIQILSCRVLPCWINVISLYNRICLAFEITGISYFGSMFLTYSLTSLCDSLMYPGDRPACICGCHAVFGLFSIIPWYPGHYRECER